MAKYSAVIFDLDGTIVDDQKLWVEAFVKVADRNNIQYSKFNTQWPEAGRDLVYSWRVIGQQDQAQILASETRREFLQLVENHESIKPREGFWELVELLKSRGYVLGLATSSYWEVADRLLENMQISGVFDAMTTGEEVTRPKPDPEIFILTCQKLGVEPGEVLVFEDAPAGLEAATAAGCEVIRVGDGFNFAEYLNIFDIIGE